MDLQSQHWIVTVALVTSSLIAFIANLLLLLVFCRRRGLRTVSNRFTINLLLINLLSSILLIPLLIADREVPKPISSLEENILVIEELFNIESFASASHNNNTLCYVAQSTVCFVCTASIFSILLIGVDQYFAVIHSLRYHAYINKFRSMVLIGTSWCVSVAFAILSGFTQNGSSLWQFCNREDDTMKHYAKTLNSIYAVVYFGAVTLAPFIAICAIHFCIYTAAHNNSERMRSTKANHVDNYMQIRAPSMLPKVQSAPNIIMLNNEQPNVSVKRSFSERTGFITNLKCRISNASVFRYREETRAAKISILVIFMVLVCYVPYGLVVLLNSNLLKISTPRSYNYAALVLLMLSNVISPFLFAYRNRRIRRELLKFLRIIRVGDGGINSIAPVVEVHRRRSEEVPTTQPFVAIPQVIITCKLENEENKPSILKRVYSTKNWSNYKKCNFITVPQSCYQTDSARGSFSSASTQMSTDDG